MNYKYSYSIKLEYSYYALCMYYLIILILFINYNIIKVCFNFVNCFTNFGSIQFLSI